MGRILVFGEEIGCQLTSQVIAPAGSYVYGSQDFLVLNVSAGPGQDLRAETEFADLACDRIGRDFCVVGIDPLPDFP